MKTLSDLGEDGFIDYLAHRLPQFSPRLARGVGDDAAVLRANGPGDKVFTMDLLVEGTHFRGETMGSAHLLGRRSISVNASDVAAMGARPRAAVIGLAAPPDTTERFVHNLVEGMSAVAEEVGCDLAGGDTTRSDNFVISVAMIGRLESEGPALLRGHARPGHTIYVTGWPGESGAGLALLTGAPWMNSVGQRRLPEKAAKHLVARHQDPTPRVEFGCLLRRLAGPESAAMIDVSDGLVRDLLRLAAASGVGVELDEAALPISHALAALRENLFEDPLRFVLHGGEDYELLFTSSLTPDALREAMKDEGVELPVHAIGRVVEDPERRLLFSEKGERPLEPHGFEHFTM